MEKGFITADASFCMPHDRFALCDKDAEGSSVGKDIAQNAQMLATATSIRVDVWKL